MKKRILMAAMALVVCMSSMPLHVNAKNVMDIETETVKEKQSHYYNQWYNSDHYDDYNWNNYNYDNYDDYNWYDYDEDDYDNYDWYGYDEDDYDNDYNWYDYDEDDYNDGYYSWYDDYEDELTVYDISVSPVKKRIRAEKSFYINLIPTKDSVWSDLLEEEWEEICEDNIESIEFSSVNSKIASVNKFTGKVKAKRKGTTVIKTTINLINEESITCKTKVIVTK